jgi:hypothetical protein
MLQKFREAFVTSRCKDDGKDPKYLSSAAQARGTQRFATKARHLRKKFRLVKSIPFFALPLTRDSGPALL